MLSSVSYVHTTHTKQKAEFEEIHAHGCWCPAHGRQKGRGGVIKGCPKHFQDKKIVAEV